MKDPILFTDMARAVEKLPKGYIPAEEAIVDVHDTLLGVKRKVTFRRRMLVKNGKKIYYWVTFGILAVEQAEAPTIVEEAPVVEETEPSGEGGGSSPGNDDW